MLSIYVVLDGFDFGAGILHLFVARCDAERRQVLSAIGPYWNGNEVWLIASGGVLIFAFPKVYAAGFSGFYLPLTMVLWLLVMRGLSIEFRSKEANPLWHTFWDTTFSIASLCLAVVFGAALGNVIRGVPVGPDGYFDGALFTNFMPGKHPGVLDWYTVCVGIFAAFVLAGQGALFLIWKTSGPLQERCYKAAKIIWAAVLIINFVLMFLTTKVRPELYQVLIAHPWSWLIAFTIAASGISIFWAMRARKELIAFISSTLLILALLAATAAGMYPNMLISTVDPAYSITALNGASAQYTLKMGLVWWSPALLLAIIYFFNIFRTFRGKISPDLYDH